MDGSYLSLPPYRVFENTKKEKLFGLLAIPYGGFVLSGINCWFWCQTLSNMSHFIWFNLEVSIQIILK
jgi:hypothetical protein